MESNRDFSAANYSFNLHEFNTITCCHVRFSFEGGHFISFPFFKI